MLTAGVQVLFAFLLTIPFSQRFADVDRFQRAVFIVTLLLTTFSAAMLMAPTAYHRLNFHQRDRERIVEASNRFAIAGIVALSLAMTGAVLLVTDFLYSSLVLIVLVAGGTGLVFAVSWYALPLRRRLQDRRQAANRD